MEEKEIGMFMKGGQQYGQFTISRGPPQGNLDEQYLKRKRGVGICIISRGTIPLKWMMHTNRVKAFFPGGLFWKFITVERLSWAAARSECVRLCRQNNFQWILFIDDDVFVPENVLEKLMRSGKDIISGVYWTKTESASPVIFEDMGTGPMFNFPPDEIIPIGGSGLGCCLINTDIFDKFDEAGIPYFVENWIYTAPDGNKLKCAVGEDHYFFIKAKELGYQGYADTSILCDHYDVKNDKMYPGEEVVRDMCKRMLGQLGRKDLVQEFDKAHKDPNKKTVVIYNDSVPFSGDELTRRGVGGSEYAVINFARELIQTGRFNVRVYCKCLREGWFDNILYKDNSKMLKDLVELKPDLLICSRNFEPLLENNFKEKYGIKQTIVWGHDLAVDPNWNYFESALPNIDKIVLLSRFHEENILQRFPIIPTEKLMIIPDGVDTRRYSERENIQKVPGKCIYSSTPYRGLDVLLKMWPQIRARVPHATLHIFSSIKVYGEYFDDSPWEDLYQTAKSMPGVYYHGTVRQDRLAKEQMESELCLYSNTFQETCCITAMECQSALTPIITSNLGALPETIKKDCGIIIPGDPYSEEYKTAFIDATVNLLTKPQVLKRMQNACRDYNFSWKKITELWVSEFFEPQEQSRDDFYKLKGDGPPEQIVVNFLLKLLKPGKDSKFLSIGCGLGEIAIEFKKLVPDAEVWGSDKSLIALDRCRLKSKTVLFANHPVENPEFEQNYFDVILCEQFDLGLLATIDRLLKPKGIIAFYLTEGDLNIISQEMPAGYKITASINRGLEKLNGGILALRKLNSGLKKKKHYKSEKLN